MPIFVGQRTIPAQNLTIYDAHFFRAVIYHMLTISCILWVLIISKNTWFYFQAVSFNFNIRPDLLYFSIRGVYPKRYHNRNLRSVTTAKTLSTPSRRFVWWKVIHSTKINVVLLTLTVKGQKILNASRIKRQQYRILIPDIRHLGL